LGSNFQVLFSPEEEGVAFFPKKKGQSYFLPLGEKDEIAPMIKFSNV
jgi:hypothetical protein